MDKLQVLGIETMTTNTVAVRINIKTLPGKQFDVGRAYRYTLKKLLEERSISI